jgi:preprotein translocase subunit YajC
MYAYFSTVTYQFAQEAAPQGVPIVQMLFFMAFIILMYQFIYARPVAKEKEQHTKMINSLITGDKIVTIGGIHGEIVEVQEGLIILKTGKNSTCSLSKSAIKLKVGAENA